MEKLDKLYVQNTTSKGKGLFTKVLIKEGETILEEEPLVACQFSWNRMYNYTACQYCLRSLETPQNMARRLTADYSLQLPYHDDDEERPQPYPCSQCNETFCNKDCYEKACERYHPLVCVAEDDHPLHRLDETWRNSHYPPESSSVMLIVRILAMIKLSSDPDATAARFQQFYNETENEKFTHKLLGDKFKKNLKNIQALLREAIPDEQLHMYTSLEGVKSLFGLIGMNGQGIGTSSLSEYVHKVDAMQLEESEREKIDGCINKLYDAIEKESGSFLDCEGSGLYSLQSCCNHSCNANAEVNFPHNNSTLALIATSDIQPNQEILISYLDECQQSRSRHSRRKFLRENYLFECLCEKCEEDIEDLSETSSSSCCEDED